MHVAILLIWLTNGEVREMGTDPDLCRTMAADIRTHAAAGTPATIEWDGTMSNIDAAICFDVRTSLDPCEEAGA